MAQKFTVPVTIKNLSSAGSDAITVFLDQETYSRLKVEAGGRITWGDGTGAGDTNLYRTSANTLRTDDAFQAFAGVITLATSGSPTVSLADGALAVDTTNNTFYFRSGGAWNQVTGGGGGGATVTVSDTEPASPSEGDLWFESDTASLFIYFDSFWIEIGGSGGGDIGQYFDAKGDLLVGVSDGVLDNLPVGADGTFLRANSSASIGLEWANIPTINSLDDVGDVSAASPSSGDYLKWNGSAWINDPINLGTDTTGNYVSDVVGGTGVTVSHTPGEGSSASVAIGQDVATSASVTFAHVSADVTGDLTGNADTATALQNARTIELSGDVSGSASFDGSANVNIFTTVNTASVAIGELNGVNITNPEEFQTLEYNGTEWVNAYAPVVSYVRNAEATTITTGTAVYLFGATGDHATVKRADNSSDTTSSKTVGLVAANITASNNGPIVTRGYVDGIDLSVGYDPGDVLWLGKNGAFTKTKPSAPDHIVFVGVVVRATNNGIVYVATQNGYELEELHNVKINGVTDAQFLRYNGASALWVNDTINLGTDTTGNYVSDVTGGTGVTVTHTPGEGSSPSIAIGQAVGTSSSVQFAAVTAPLIGDVTGNSSTATSLQTARTISLTGDVSGSASFNGSSDVSISATVQPNSVALGTDTTGNYMSGVTSGTGVTVTHTPGEGSSATIAIGQDVATSASVTFAQLTTTGDATISGNLTVSGTTTTVNTETINLADNIITLNSNETSTPSQNAGLEIERGTSTNVFLRWNETTDKWQFTNDGTNYTDLGAGGATISASAPSTPDAGSMWFDSDTAQVFVYYDSSWIEVGGASGGARMQVLAGAPTSPLEGTMWFDSDTAQTFVYYDSQWIEIGASAMAATVSTTAPASPIGGQVWFNSDTGGTYVYYESNWIEIGAAPANAILQAVDAKGDLIVGTADNTVDNLAVGSNGQTLIADSSTATGLKWALSPETDLITTKGDLLVGTAADTLARQGVGSNGQILVADSGQTNGVAWVDPLSNRNVIINGGFDIWQRGTSSTTIGNTYLADRWMRAIPTGGTQSQETSDLPSGSGFRYAWKHAASATNAYMQMGQQIEYVNCKHLQGKTVTISFWAKALNSNAGSTGLTVRTRTHASVDGAAIFAGTNTDTSVTITTSWVKYSVTRTLASTFGALSLEFVLGSHVSGDGFLLTGVQLEPGSVATPFEFEDYGTTLAKCQRYYEKSYDINVAPGTNTTTGMYHTTINTQGGSVLVLPINFKVPKRTNGYTMTYYRYTGTINIWDFARSGSSGTVTITTNYRGESLCVDYQAHVPAWTPVETYGQWTCSAEL